MGIRNTSKIQIRNTAASIGGAVPTQEQEEFLQRYFELNGLTPGLNAIKVVRTAKKSDAQAQTAAAVAKLDPISAAAAIAAANAGTSSFGNEIFATDPGVATEAARQLALISETTTFEGHNLMHLLRCITDPTVANVVLTPDNRKQFLDLHPNTIEGTKQLLLELDQKGYLDIVKKRHKYHDYKASQKAYDTWNSVLLHQGQDTMGKPYYNQPRHENYLIPFDSSIYLNRTANDPTLLATSMNGFHMLPYQDGFINVMGDNGGVDLLDLRDYDFIPENIDSTNHRYLYNYIASPNLPEKIKGFYDLAAKGIPDRVTPRYKLNNSVVFQGKSGNHYQVPEEFLYYLYNNYYGEDLDIDILESPQIQAKNAHLTANPQMTARETYWRRGKIDAKNSIISVKRRGSATPLIFYRFGYDNDDMKVIK